MKKRMIPLLLAVALGSAEAEVVLDGLPLEKLYALRDKVNARIVEMEQSEDQQVYDSGVYSVGDGIPAGDYVLFENDGAVFASMVVRREAAEDSELLSHHLINGQSVVRLKPNTWVTLSEARAYPLSRAPRSEEGPWGEGGYLVGETLPAGTYQLVISDMAPLSSYSVYDGILDTDAQLIRFELLHGPAEITLNAGEYIELSGCGLQLSTSTEGTEP